MFIKKIQYCGQQCVIACDENCKKAWGNNNRKIEYVTSKEINEDDFYYLPDHELGEAPDDPKTYEGGHAKPIGIKSNDEMNKWCARECERCVIEDYYDGIENDIKLKLPDFSKNYYNINQDSKK